MRTDKIPAVKVTTSNGAIVIINPAAISYIDIDSRDFATVHFDGAPHVVLEKQATERLLQSFDCEET